MKADSMDSAPYTPRVYASRRYAQDFSTPSSSSYAYAYTPSSASSSAGSYDDEDQYPFTSTSTSTYAQSPYRGVSSSPASSLFSSSSSLYGPYPSARKYSFGQGTVKEEHEEEVEEFDYTEEENELEGELEAGEEQLGPEAAKRTYKESVRRQLQTVSFTVGIKVFRARRRIRRVFAQARE